MTYGEIRPEKYRKAEIRAAQEAAVALAEGDRELAIADLERITARDDGMLAERAREALRVLKNADQKSTLE